MSDEASEGVEDDGASFPDYETAELGMSEERVAVVDYLRQLVVDGMRIDGADEPAVRLEWLIAQLERGEHWR